MRECTTCVNIHFEKYIDRHFPINVGSIRYQRDWTKEKEGKQSLDDQDQLHRMVAGGFLQEFSLVWTEYWLFIWTQHLKIKKRANQKKEKDRKAPSYASSNLRLTDLLADGGEV